jgi:hypothetical protein
VEWERGSDGGRLERKAVVWMVGDEAEDKPTDEAGVVINQVPSTMSPLCLAIVSTVVKDRRYRESAYEYGVRDKPTQLLASKRVLNT